MVTRYAYDKVFMGIIRIAIFLIKNNLLTKKRKKQKIYRKQKI